MRLSSILATALVALAACSPGGPPGVDREALNAAVSKAVGDPNSCVFIAEQGSGRVLYRYNSATACANKWPACDKPGEVKLADILGDVAKDPRPRMASCYTLPDRSRSVGWAAGPIAGRTWVYAAVMEGDRAFPGRMMVDRLDNAFAKAKVSKAP